MSNDQTVNTLNGPHLWAPQLKIDPKLPIFTSTKTYDPGFSCAFRQHLADSHCNQIHGYALSVHLEFSTQNLDARNWSVDFGGLKKLKEDLSFWFDHTLAVAEDDPMRQTLENLELNGLAVVRVFEGGVGCERFSEFVWSLASSFLLRINEHKRIWVSKVQVREHGGNSAIYTPPIAYV